MQQSTTRPIGGSRSTVSHREDLPPLDRWFGVSRRGSSLKTEILAGIATFLAGMYIIVVNPAILSDAGIPFASALSATVLISFMSSLAMGLYARNPILVAPGMGMNALFTYTLVMGAGLSWEVALGCVFWSGVLFATLALFNVRRAVIEAIPLSLRYAITCGIGLFITFIGLKNAGFIVGSDATLVSLGTIDASLVTFFLGLVATAIFVILRFNGALIMGIALTTLMAAPMGRFWGDEVMVAWNGLAAWPDFGAVLKVDVIGALKVAYLPFIFVMLFTNFFDALSCFMALSESADLKDEEGNPRNLKRSMTVDAFASMIAAPLGTSAAQTFIESGAGVAQGGRTGLVAVVIAILFLPFLFLSPLLSLVPGIATAPALVLVGLFMMTPISKIDWSHFDQAFPAFLAIILMPLTYSITLGIAFGFMSFVLIKALTGKVREIKPAMWVTAALAVLMLLTTQ
ncbi:NCS2 family permease [Halomonas elongata]|uniref:NCS2 family permease n=1 Tax=Halomonas eurihalina TaxID=42566 RepID=A0A5D9DDL9_HALER|nr:MULTISPECIES: NCS2 family permease [Halomonas]MBW5799078.1 NCS2 family permease [Halomonas elongata]MDR5858566.1 NCS2 family permease [Halomonas eurihalina]RAW08908.1 permease [Halomonas elongata]TZG40755.1 NCS2 family permease [Halomonas eurihalina]WVI73066.1 NCS2 family permease [Halomonas elongata]